MRSEADVSAVLALVAQGKTQRAIEQETGVSRATIRAWARGQVPRRSELFSASSGDHRRLPEEYVYLLGLYLGDGCISAYPRGVYKLRINLDAEHSGIIDACAAAMLAVAPGRRVHRQRRRSNYTDSAELTHVEVSSYYKSWPLLFPQHGPGRKHERPILLDQWQRDLVRDHPESLLRGLIHSDGCRFINTGRAWRNPRYSFSNLSDDIRAIFCHACDLIGVRWTMAPKTVYVSRKADVARLDEFIGPKF